MKLSKLLHADFRIERKIDFVNQGIGFSASEMTPVGTLGRMLFGINMPDQGAERILQRATHVNAIDRRAFFTTRSSDVQQRVPVHNLQFGLEANRVELGFHKLVHR